MVGQQERDKTVLGKREKSEKEKKKKKKKKIHIHGPHAGSLPVLTERDVSMPADIMYQKETRRNERETFGPRPFSLRQSQIYNIKDQIKQQIGLINPPPNTTMMMHSMMMNINYI
jgi:hypothetical protein